MAASIQFEIMTKHYWRYVEYGVYSPNGDEVWSGRVRGKTIELSKTKGKQMATASCRSWNGSVDVGFLYSGNAGRLSRNKGSWFDAKSFDFRGKRYHWSRPCKTSDVFKVVDDKSEPVAKVGITMWAVAKTGWYEFLKPVDEELIEAIVLLGLIELEAQRTTVSGDTSV